MEQAARQRRSRGCPRNEGHQVGVGEEPEGPDPGAAGLVGVAVQDQLGPVPGVPAQGATPAGVLDQGRNRPGTTRRVAGLGPTLAAPRVRHTRRHDQTVPAADLQHPRSRPVQRTLGSHEHAPTSTDQTCQRIPHTRSVHRHGHAHPRRPVPGAAKPPMKTAGGPQKWVLLYVERWLKAPMLTPDGTMVARVKGTPQGGPISPLIANIFLHHGFDTWMTREYPGVQFERLAGDAVVHCVTERQARQVREAIGGRLAEIGLELHPDKTRIVYCKDGRRPLEYEQVSFTFCGYVFRPRKAYDKKRKQGYTRFLPAVAPGKLTDVSRKVASWRLHRRTTLTLDDLAGVVNPVLRGWLAYFTVFYPSAVIPIGTVSVKSSGTRVFSLFGL